MWFPFALVSALISGGRRVYDKHLTNTFGNFAMGFIVQAFSLLPCLALIFLLPHGTEIGSLPWRFWWPLLIIWCIYPVQTYFLYRAVREADVSTVTPVFCLLPVFNIITSFILLGEIPSVFGWVGIALIVCGTYLVLSQKTKNKIALSTPVVLMLAAVVCIAVGTSLDKISIQASNPPFYAFMNTFGAMVIFSILMYFHKEKDSFSKMVSKRWFWPFMLLGVLQAVSYVSMSYAFKYGPVSYVLAIRAGSYILAGVYGIIILKEAISTRKMIAFAFFLLGVLALAFA
jgi:uncharacterized membrane protein